MKNEFCDCEDDGFCPRYKKEMSGRLRQICQGENVDAGTAANYRNLWLSDVGIDPQGNTRCPFLGNKVKDAEGETVKRECIPCGGKLRMVFKCNHPARQPDEVMLTDCGTCEYRPRDISKARALILRNHLSPGDVLVMSAAIHSLHKQHPGKFVTAVDTTCNAVYEYNPDVIPIEKAQELNAELIETHYPAINQSNQRGIHFMQGYCEFFEDALGVRVPLLTNRPHVYLSRQERDWMDQVQQDIGRRQHFWIVNAGRKGDYTTKHWGTDNFQRVIDLLRGRVIFVQVGAAEHHHPPLRNVINFIGKTDSRQLIRLVHHSDGILCGVTFMQHLAAAFEKPCMCILGGREAVTWNQYPRQQTFHTVGLLPCSKGGGCWKSRVVALGDDDEKDKSLCDNPIIGEEPIGKCMALIRPEEIAEKILLTQS